MKCLSGLWGSQNKNKTLRINSAGTLLLDSKAQMTARDVTGLCVLLGVFQRPLTLVLLQKYRDTNGRRIVIQIGGVYTFCQKEGILLQKYRDRNGRCIAILFKNIGVRGRCDSPDITFLRPEFWPIFSRVLGLLLTKSQRQASWTKRKNSTEKIHQIQWRRRPGNADHVPCRGRP